VANAIDLQFVINGVTSSFSLNPNQPLHAAISHVLAQTGNKARPASDWIATDARGTVLDQSRRLDQLGLAPGGQIFLALSAGIGG
jgi:hypothetical protein